MRQSLTILPASPLTHGARLAGRGPARRGGGLAAAVSRTAAHLAAACAISIMAASASLAEVRFDYTVEGWTGADSQATRVPEPVDPARCGTAVGWIEAVTRTMETEAAVNRLPWRNPVRVRRGSDVETMEKRQFRVGRGPFAGHVPATMMIDYRGCVVPSGKVLLALKATVTVEADDGPQRFVVTYDGPPMPIEARYYEIDPAHFRVETELGSAVVSRVSLEYFRIKLRLQNQGATQ